jgi:hypothetical protein
LGFAPRPPPGLSPWTSLGDFHPQNPCQQGRLLDEAYEAACFIVKVGAAWGDFLTIEQNGKGGDYFAHEIILVNSKFVTLNQFTNL